jgi:hypothetical protein
MVKLTSTLSVILAVLALFGCGPDCRLMCEEVEKADCYANANDAPDCERECKHIQDWVTNAECQPEYDTYLLCLDDLDNICDAYAEACVDGEDCDDPKCDNELEALQECLAEYCAEHPRNNECVFGVGGTQ